MSNLSFRPNDEAPGHPSRRWKRIAIASAAVAVCALVALAAMVAVPLRLTRMTDDRLIGTWQSDADRTIAGIRKQRPVNDKQEAALRSLFGKMRVTYTPTALTINLDDWTDTRGYEVLGKDKHSVVIREIQDNPPPLDAVLDSSAFTVIQFDGPDSYWLYTQIGGIREHFKRVRQPRGE